MTPRAMICFGLLVACLAVPATAATATKGITALARGASAVKKAPAPARTASAAKKQAAPPPPAGDAKGQAAPAPRPVAAARRLEDIHIEGEIPAPQVLFVTARDQRRFTRFHHQRYLKSSLQVGEETLLPTRIATTGNPAVGPATR